VAAAVEDWGELNTGGLGGGNCILLSVPHAPPSPDPSPPSD
jgi:hypothetical protein